MSNKKLGFNIKLLGIVTVVGAVIWWFIFWTMVLDDSRIAMIEASQCLVSSSGDCSFINTMAYMRGIIPYNPMVFWIGVVLIVVGWIIMKFSSNDAGSTKS